MTNMFFSECVNKTEAERQEPLRKRIAELEAALIMDAGEWAMAQKEQMKRELEGQVEGWKIATEEWQRRAEELEKRIASLEAELECAHAFHKVKCAELALEKSRNLTASIEIALMVAARET